MGIVRDPVYAFYDDIFREDGVEVIAASARTVGLKPGMGFREAVYVEIEMIEVFQGVHPGIRAR
jgi:hypothetical protein